MDDKKWESLLKDAKGPQGCTLGVEMMLAPKKARFELVDRVWAQLVMPLLSPL